MIIVTFDLENGTSDDYERVYEVLEAEGFSRETPKERRRLPNTAVMGEVEFETMARLRDKLQATLDLASGGKVSSIFVGELKGWAARRGASAQSRMRAAAARRQV